MSRRCVLMPVLAVAALVGGAASAGSIQAVYSFKRQHGRYPDGALVAVGGVFYGAAGVGGPKTKACVFGCGTVYRVTRDGKYHVVHAFTGGSDGANPGSTLIYSGGVLYGSTGGANTGGGIFALTPDGAETVLHTFTGRDGDGPIGRLALIGDTLYGVTEYGGRLDKGVAFSLTTGGTYTVLHEFGGSGDGQNPAGGLAVLQGVLYGTTAYGGAANGGTVFSLRTDGTETVLHSFSTDDPLGTFPGFDMAAVDDRVFGTAGNGGACSLCGTLFSVQPDGSVTLAYDFRYPRGGHLPIGDLTAANGTVYGVTYRGGSQNAGIVYSYGATAGFKTLASFPGDGSAGLRCNGVTEDDGRLLGTCEAGGAYDRGAVVSVRR